MRSIAIYILSIIFLSAVLMGLTYQVKVPSGAIEMQVYSQDTPLVGSSDSVDEMTNFNIYHYFDKVVSIKDGKLDNTLGVAYVYRKGEMSAEQLIKDFSAKIAFEQDLEDGVTYYGHTKADGKRVMLGDEEINIQIVINKENIIVGFPLIMGSY